MSVDQNLGSLERWRARGQLLSVMAVWNGEVSASGDQCCLGITEAACVLFVACGAGRMHMCIGGCTLAGASSGALAAAAAAVCSRCSSSKKLPTRSTSPYNHYAICRFTPADALPTGRCGTMAGNRQLRWRNQVHGAGRHAWLSEARHQPIQQDMNMCSCCGSCMEHRAKKKGLIKD